MRAPDLVIGPRTNPQTERWHLFRPWGIQIALHRWSRSDSDRALHDHSADNWSILLWGCYREWFSHSWETPRWKLRIPFIPYFRRAGEPHRVELHRGGPVWTIWIRFKPFRKWGFWCRTGWRPYEEYIAERDYSAPGSESTVGRGCD
jgi:hypothetical protein